VCGEDPQVDVRHERAEQDHAVARFDILSHALFSHRAFVDTQIQRVRFRDDRFSKQCRAHRNVELLSQLKVLHMRILSAVSAKSAKVSGGSGNMSSRPLKWNASELMKYSGSSDLIKLDRELNYMADIGIIAPREKSAFFQQMTDTTIALTDLGLQLYARCNGHRGTAQKFYGMPVSSAAALALDK